MSDKELVPAANTEIIEASGVDRLLQQIRPQWQATNLVQRVTRILPVDPSSACQRIFNAAVHDLRENQLGVGPIQHVDLARKDCKIGGG